MPPEDWGSTIVATGPLTSPALAEAIRTFTGEDSLAFFDAIAPVVHHESIDMDMCWMQSRYDKGEGADYINCPLDQTQYRAFIAALLEGEKTEFKEWETSTPYFEGCLPIEVMASRGEDTLRYGPMKPVGLADPRREGHRPYAVVQLRQDNALGTLWNMVGFQTKLKHGEQTRIFRTIPGLENAQFARLGGLHRNTFINSPRLLDVSLRLKARPLHPLRRTGHRRRRLCRKRCHRPARGPLRRRRGERVCRLTTAGFHRARRPAAPHHRRRRRQDLPAHEREFWPVSGFAEGRPHQGPRPQEGDERQSPGRDRRVAG